MAITSGRKDPIGSFRFRVDIQGMQAGFAEVDGLNTETDLIEYRQGNEDIAGRKIPGLHKYTNITFKRGFTNSKDLWKWHQSVSAGGIKRLPGTITLFDEGRNPVVVWSFTNGLPVKLVGPDLNANANEVAIDELELTVEGLTLEHPPFKP